MHCPLCHAQHHKIFHQDKKRTYYRCAVCSLVFVPKEFHLSHADEKSEYDKHENALDDEGYLNFLSRATTPLINYLDAQNKDELHGLDFGCGPAPALANVLQQNGLNVSLYDPYYFPNQAALEKQYDFVTCTEVVEHFNRPKESLSLLINLVKPNGVLVIMTKLVIDDARFKNWHYKNDPTHISFFSVETFDYISTKYKLKLIQQDKDVIFLQK